MKSMRSMLLTVLGFSTVIMTVGYLKHREPPRILFGEPYKTEFGGTVYRGPQRTLTRDGWAVWWNDRSSMILAVEGGGSTYGVKQDVWQSDGKLIVRTSVSLVTIDVEKFTSAVPIMCIVRNDGSATFGSLTPVKYGLITNILQEKYQWELSWAKIRDDNAIDLIPRKEN